MACAISMGGSALFMGFAAQAKGLMPNSTTQFVRLTAPEARQSIQLRSMAVQAEIAGLSVATRIELEVYSPNDRVLEAELEFPLLEGQAVTGFALDINGEMRPAVPVTKTKGQQVFEDVTRTWVDPSLLESTGGQNHKLWIYPIAAKGGRMSEDFTGGFGPEEYSLRTAMPGTYTVVAQFYVHPQQIVAPSTTIMLKLTTGFGTPNQKDEDVVLRLTGQGRQMTVGTFNVGGKPLTKS